LLKKNPVISTQVLSEYINVVKKRLQLPKKEVIDICRQNIEDCTLYPVGKSTLKLAGELITRYDFQLFDSIIVASALEANCKILYTEDCQHKQIVEGKLTIINPFL
jgi:predicted nucleic acid-binding protein